MKSNNKKFVSTVKALAVLTVMASLGGWMAVSHSRPTTENAPEKASIQKRGESRSFSIAEWRMLMK